VSAAIPSLQFQVLGPVACVSSQVRLDLADPRRRTLLALLLVHANRTVSDQELIAVVPDGGALARLRADLPGRLYAVEGGHTLKLGPRELDATAFTERVKHGSRALHAGEPVIAAEFLRAALAMWRGPAYADVAHEPFAQVAAGRLEELRLIALEARIEADLLLGRHQEIEAELDALVLEHPARLRFARQARAVKGLGSDPRLDTQVPRERTCLIVRPGHRLQRVVPLDAARRLTLGRDPTADIPIAWDARVSRLHALLARAGDRWLLSDDGFSRNGTFCNDERVTAPRPLRDGDVIQLGETTLVFRDATPASDDTLRTALPASA
jgi:hypothetical protein